MATGKTRGERRTGATIKHKTSLVGSSGSSSGKVSFHLSFSSAACLASTTDILCFCNINFLLNQTLLRATQRCQGEEWWMGKQQRAAKLRINAIGGFSFAFACKLSQEIDKFSRKLEIYLSKIVTRDKLSLVPVTTCHIQ